MAEARQEGNAPCARIGAPAQEPRHGFPCGGRGGGGGAAGGLSSQVRPVLAQPSPAKAPAKEPQLQAIMHQRAGRRWPAAALGCAALPAQRRPRPCKAKGGTQHPAPSTARLCATLQAAAVRRRQDKEDQCSTRQRGGALAPAGHGPAGGGSRVAEKGRGGPRRSARGVAGRGSCGRSGQGGGPCLGRPGSSRSGGSAARRCSGSAPARRDGGSGGRAVRPAAHGAAPAAGQPAGLPAVPGQRRRRSGWRRGAGRRHAV